jgi:hypothetical protein
MVVLLLVMTLGPLARVLLLVREDMLHLSLILVVVGGCAIFSVVEGLRDDRGRQISSCFGNALAVVVEVE